MEVVLRDEQGRMLGKWHLRDDEVIGFNPVLKADQVIRQAPNEVNKAFHYDRQAKESTG